MSGLQLVTRAFDDAEGGELEFYQGEDGSVWMSSEQLGKALGYSDPLKGVAQLYERNMDELRELKREIALPLNLRKSGSRKRLTVWPREALHHMSMLAKTEVGKVFRRRLRKVSTDLEAGNKVLVDRDYLSGLISNADAAMSMVQHAGSVMAELASFAGRMLNQKKLSAKQHPELFNLPSPQTFFEFYEPGEECDEDGGES